MSEKTGFGEAALLGAALIWGTGFVAQSMGSDTLSPFTYNGVRNVIAACRKFGVKRMVQISSTAVYGVPKKHPILETDPLIGVGPYGHAKIAAETVSPVGG